MREWLLTFRTREFSHALYAKVPGATIISAIQNFMAKNDDVDVISAMEIPEKMDGLGLPIGPDPTKTAQTDTPNGTH